MNTPFAWTCPFCSRVATITDTQYFSQTFAVENETVHGMRGFRFNMIVCPNALCKQYELVFTEHDSGYDCGNLRPMGAHTALWTLRPNSKAVPFPNYIPTPIVEDYNEACLIRDLSPKASATLSRRCLQGMIRDFFGVRERNLFLEVNAIEDKVDGETWSAINAVRKVGNIGAHMESDISVIVEVEPEEAQLLIDLIEILIKEWYVARHDRSERMRGIVQLAQDKDAAKKLSD